MWASSRTEPKSIGGPTLMIRPNIFCSSEDMTTQDALGGAIFKIESTTKQGPIVQKFTSEKFAPSATAHAEV